jgi:hypothetical protein
MHRLLIGKKPIVYSFALVPSALRRTLAPEKSWFFCRVLLATAPGRHSYVRRPLIEWLLYDHCREAISADLDQ